MPTKCTCKPAAPRPLVPKRYFMLHLRTRVLLTLADNDGQVARTCDENEVQNCYMRRLENQGLVQRVGPAKKNSGRTRYVLTEKGRKTAAQLRVEDPKVSLQRVA